MDRPRIGAPAREQKAYLAVVRQRATKTKQRIARIKQWQANEERLLVELEAEVEFYSRLGR
jgi:hypothetical protein